MNWNKHYILKGKEIVETDLMTWARWLEENPTDRIIKQETVANGKWVSTVFLGLDHSFSQEGAPILFETMIFPGKGKPLSEEYCDRYATYDEAVEGHAKALLIAQYPQCSCCRGYHPAWKDNGDPWHPCE